MGGVDDFSPFLDDGGWMAIYARSCADDLRHAFAVGEVYVLFAG